MQSYSCQIYVHHTCVALPPSSPKVDPLVYMGICIYRWPPFGLSVVTDPTLCYPKNYSIICHITHTIQTTAILLNFITEHRPRQQWLAFTAAVFFPLQADRSNKWASVLYLSVLSMNYDEKIFVKDCCQSHWSHLKPRLSHIVRSFRCRNWWLNWRTKFL